MIQRELGETDDPKELIPGDPAAIEGFVQTLTEHGSRTESVGSRLGTVRTGDWSGPAADAFHTSFAPQPSNWYRVSDALHASAGSLSGYASTLRWAQTEASQAVALWKKAQAATGNEKQQLQKQAKELLQRLRSQLSSAGASAESVLNELVANASGSAGVTGPNASLSASLPASTSTSGGKAGGIDPRTGKAMENEPGATLSLGQLEGKADLFDANASGSTSIANMTMTGHANAGVGVQGSASAGINQDGFNASANVSAGLHGHADGSVVAGPAELTGSADAIVGAQAGGDLTVGEKGVSGDVNAFAGAKISGNAGGDVGGVGVGVSGEGWAGVGVQADFTDGIGKDGKFHLGGDFGAGLGLGGKIGGQITIDPSKVVHTAQSIGHGIAHLASDLNPFG
ncbi:MAG: hypothetical protein J2O49_06405 [Sciscionella sp.]|nr:hypothetical protein [Sciscionella sp.]